MEPFGNGYYRCIEEHQGAIMESIGLRKGELTDMAPDGKGRVRMDFMMPSRGSYRFPNWIPYNDIWFWSYIYHSSSIITVLTKAVSLVSVTTVF